MNFLKKKLYEHYLPKLIKNNCDSTIPRSGKNGKKTNCFVVMLFKNSDPYLLLENITSDKLTGLQWNGNKFENELSISISEVDDLTLKIEHYYGLDQISYTGIFDYVIERFTRYSYLKIHLLRLNESITQYLFNKHSLETKKRYDFLKLLTERFTGKNNGFSYVSVMSEMHTNRSFLHPEYDKEAQKIEAYLQGFVDTGELKVINHDYHLTGHAYKAINDYEDQDRKHKATSRAQWLMIILTLILAILTAVQAGIIVLPMLLNLS